MLQHSNDPVSHTLSNYPWLYEEDVDLASQFAWSPNVVWRGSLGGRE
jgi:hypothetical protein